MQTAHAGHQLHRRRGPRANGAGYAGRRALRPLGGKRTPRRPVRRLDKERLRAYALRALTRRAHATQELRYKLARRALNPGDVDSILRDSLARGWLDDQRFARSYARARATHRRLGHYRIARELRQKGVAPEWIEQALAEVFPTQENEQALVRQRIEKRLRGQRPPYPQKLLRSVYASLLRAGFSSAIIRNELFGRVRSDLADEFAVNEAESAKDEQA